MDRCWGDWYCGLSGKVKRDPPSTDGVREVLVVFLSPLLPSTPLPSPPFRVIVWPWCSERESGESVTNLAEIKDESSAGGSQRELEEENSPVRGKEGFSDAAPGLKTGCLQAREGPHFFFGGGPGISQQLGHIYDLIAQ